MIECPSCGREHRPGTLFCNECGVYLPTGGPLGTEPVPGEVPPGAGVQGWETDSGQEEMEDEPAMLRIEVLPSGRQVRLPFVEGIQVGRLDAAHGIFPDVDLTPDGGLEGGVSRRHCKIYHDDGKYFVEDLGSANGTFLRGERLTPYLSYVFEDGDELQLGRIGLRIVVQKQN